MFNYIDIPMDKFSDRPDRTLPPTPSNNYKFGKKSDEFDPRETVLNPAHSPEFGKPDRKDRR